MKNTKDMIGRAVLAGLGVAAVEVVTIPGVPVWVIPIAKVVAAIVGGASPSLVGIKRTRYFKSATPGGVDQVVDEETPKK